MADGESTPDLDKQETTTAPPANLPLNTENSENGQPGVRDDQVAKEHMEQLKILKNKQSAATAAVTQKRKEIEALSEIMPRGI